MATNTTVRRCLVANNACDGVKLWRDGGLIENTLIYGRGDGNDEPTYWSAVVIDSETPGSSFSLVNVTVDDALGYNYILHALYDHPEVEANLTIRNCIFRGMGPSSGLFASGATQLTMDHNLFYLPSSDYVLEHGEGASYGSGGLGQLGANNLYADPLFIRPAWGEEGDYHLRASSPAIDSGSSQDAPLTDLEGHPRDLAPDLGAYEYVPGGE
ncbi:MAG: hypothetical protein JRJ59_01430 [Deltaproteobacteria bacterium]|nr:hypothetical protein [Deltaproteobacteria bacterium]